MPVGAKCQNLDEVHILSNTAFLAWHCICSICTIVTLALPDLHPSRTTDEAFAHANNSTP